MRMSHAASSFRSCSAQYVPAAPLPMITKRVGLAPKMRASSGGMAPVCQPVPAAGFEPALTMVLNHRTLPLVYAGSFSLESGTVRRHYASDLMHAYGPRVWAR